METRKGDDGFCILLGEISSVTTRDSSTGELFGHGPSRQSISSNSPRAAEVGAVISSAFNLPSDEYLASEFKDMRLNGASPFNVNGSICEENRGASSHSSFDPSDDMPISTSRPESVTDDHQRWQRYQGSSASMHLNGGSNNFFEPGLSVFTPGFESPSLSLQQQQQQHQHRHLLMNAPFPGYIPHRQQHQLDRQFPRLEYERCYRNHSQQLQNTCLGGHVLGRGSPALHLDFHMPIPQQQQAGQVNPFNYDENIANRVYNPFRPSLQSNILGGGLHGSSDLPSMRFYFMERPEIFGLIDSIIQKLYNLEMDPSGLIFTEESRKIIDQIFIYVICNVFELMTSPSGNHLVEKLVEICTEEQLTEIVKEISDNSFRFSRLACDRLGTHVVRRIIKTVKSSLQYYWISSSLKHHLLPLVKDKNGAVVVELCMQRLPPHYRESFLGPAVHYCVEIARDKRGCCFLQKYIGVLDGNQKIKLISSIASKACELSQDPYGNYVVQFILEQEIAWATGSILDNLEGHYRALSLQKHSSNVVEKCMLFAGVDGKYKIIKELIRHPYLLETAQDQYGNYVIQSAFVACKEVGALRAELLKAIKPLIRQLCSNPYGKNVLQSMKRNSK